MHIASRPYNGKSERLRDAQRHLKQIQNDNLAAKAIGRSPRTLWRWRNGEHAPNWESHGRMRALGLLITISSNGGAR